MYYYQKKKKVKLTSGGQLPKGQKEGGGIFDSIISAVTSNVMKDVAKNVATKTLTEVGNRGSQKVIDKILPKAAAQEQILPPRILSKAQLTEGQIILPRKGRGLTEESKNILNKYLKIQDYVKNSS